MTSPAGTRLIFLDLDGVICCNFHGELEESKLLQLKRVVDASAAKVVMSSDWRRKPELRQRAEATLAHHGIECIGATPQYPLFSRVRPKEILAWLSQYKEPVVAWCAVDDRDLVLEEGGTPHFIGHFVLTEFHTGLTPALADQMLRRLLPTQELDAAPLALSSFAPPSARAWSPQTHVTSPLASPPPAPASARSSRQLASAVARGAVPRDDAPQEPLTSMAALLEETALTSLAPLLSGETLHGLSGLLSEEDGGSRVTLLTHLRKMGIARIGDRQTLANCLGRAHRLGRICVSTPEAPAARVAVEEEAEATGSAHASGEDVDASVAAHLQGAAPLPAPTARTPLLPSRQHAPPTLRTTLCTTLC